MTSKQFRRKFIPLRDDATKLNLDLEICIDSQNRLFVRHYTLFLIYGWSLEEIDPYKPEKIDSYLSNIKSQCKLLYRQSIRWLGYKFTCQNIVLIDEKDNLEIETLAIVLPFDMFVDLIEYTWNASAIAAKIAEHPELAWYANQPLQIKIAKWLKDNQINLSNLTSEILTNDRREIINRYQLRSND